MPPSYVIERDRGRQFFAAQISDLAVYESFAGKAVFSKEPSVILQVKIPLKETLTFNLTQNTGNGANEYFIAGKTIHPEAIKYLEVSVTELQKRIEKEVLVLEGISPEAYLKLNWSNPSDIEELRKLSNKFVLRMQETVPTLEFLPIH